MSGKTAFFLIALLFAAAGVTAYWITGKPEPVGEVSGEVLKVTVLTQKTEAKAELLIQLDDGRKVRLVTLERQRPDPGARLLLMEYRSASAGISSFEVIGPLP